MTSFTDTFEPFRPPCASPEESAGLRFADFLDGKKMLEAWEILRGRDVMEVFLELSVSSMLRVCWVR